MILSSAWSSWSKWFVMRMKKLSDHHKMYDYDVMIPISREKLPSPISRWHPWITKVISKSKWRPFTHTWSSLQRLSSWYKWYDHHKNDIPENDFTKRNVSSSQPSSRSWIIITPDTIMNHHQKNIRKLSNFIMIPIPVRCTLILSKKSFENISGFHRLSTDNHE